MTKLPPNSTALSAQFSSAFIDLGFINAFKGAGSIFIKPNLTYPNYNAGVKTRKDFISALVAALRKINTTTKIYIGEGEGGYNSFLTTEDMRNMGFDEIAENYPNVEIINLSKMETRVVELKAKGKISPSDYLKYSLKKSIFPLHIPCPKFTA